MSLRPCVIGAGIATCLGGDVEENLYALKQSPKQAAIIEHHSLTDAERLPYHLLKGAELDHADKRLYQQIDQVVSQALGEAQLNDEQRSKMALFVGSSSHDISVSEQLYKQELISSKEPLALRLSSFGNIAGYVRKRFSIKGEDFSINTACTSSANALLYASSMLRTGQVDYVLVLAVELFNDTTALGFNNLELLTHTQMTPFDKARDGIVLGEACGALVLTRKEPEAKEFVVLGGANLCDTHSISSANPDGSSIAMVIRRALDNAGVTPGQIRAIKAHGTASLRGDEAEAAGVLQVFQDLPDVCAIKPYIGHTLGACGLVEMILFYQTILAGFIIATPGIASDEKELGLKLTQRHESVGSGIFLLNYFGFGGNNCSLVIANGEQ